MKKVVSIALFGAGNDYAAYLSAFVLAHHNIYPASEGWRLYLAIDGRLSEATSLLISRLSQARLLDFCVYPPAPLCKAMLWRTDLVFRAAWGGEDEPWKADFVFCRDLDSPPMPRDRVCMEAFMAAAEEKKLVVHTVHDSDQHVGIMGGLCGFHAPAFREVTGIQSLEELYTRAALTDEQWAVKGADQDVLNRLLLRQGGPRIFEHRYNGWHAGPGKRKARGPGWYKNAGVSMPVPSIGNGSSLRLETCLLLDQPGVMRADLLGNHLGCAGYDIEAAKRFWMLYGDPNIAAKVAACEVNHGDR